MSSGFGIAYVRYLSLSAITIQWMEGSMKNAASDIFDARQVKLETRKGKVLCSQDTPTQLRQRDFIYIILKITARFA